MNILTIGRSPYLNNGISKLHKNIISCLSEDYHIESIVSHHDVGYFLPNNDGDFLFNNVVLHPYLGDKGGITNFTIDIMKKVQPQLVIDISQRKENLFLAGIKNLYSDLFKWINFTVTTGPFYKDTHELSLADHVIITNSDAARSLSSLKTNYSNLNIGVDENIFKIKNTEREFGVLTIARSHEESNLYTFIQACKNTKTNGYIHTNHTDPSNYNVNKIIDICEANEYVKTNNYYNTEKEGITEEEMVDLYNKYPFFVDCSMQPKTGICMIEALLCGCEPISGDLAAHKDIMINNNFINNVISSDLIMLKNEEYGQIIGNKQLEENLIIKKERFNKEKKNINLMYEMRDIGLNFTKDIFNKRFKDIIEKTINDPKRIIVDVY